MLSFLLGACVFGIGVMFGMAVQQQAYKDSKTQE